MIANSGIMSVFPNIIIDLYIQLFGEKYKTEKLYGEQAQTDYIHFFQQKWALNNP